MNGSRSSEHLGETKPDTQERMIIESTTVTEW